MTAASNNRRRARVEVSKAILVVDSMSNTEVGRLVNIHEEGFMVIGAKTLNENCIYQLTFKLSEVVDGKAQVNLGAECLWIRETVGGDQFWAGFHIIDIASEDMSVIRTLSEIN